MPIKKEHKNLLFRFINLINVLIYLRDCFIDTKYIKKKTDNDEFQINAIINYQ